MFDSLVFWVAGWNMKVCVVMGVAQLLLWASWAGLSHHPSRLKLWAVVMGGGLGMLLEIYDFPPYKAYMDAHALWHATTVPLTFLWWSFIKDDAEFRTTAMVKRDKDMCGGLQCIVLFIRAAAAAYSSVNSFCNNRSLTAFATTAR
ncbi:hypothetical protein ACLOJK_037942 [Asimina triloba]